MKSSAKLDKIQRMSDKFKGNMALLITSIVWGSGFIAQKLGGEAMPPLAFNATRQLMAAIALLPLATFSVSSSGYFSKEKNTESQIRYKKNRMILAGIVCGGCLVLGSDLQQLGLQTVSAGKSGLFPTTRLGAATTAGLGVFAATGAVSAAGSTSANDSTAGVDTTTAAKI